jgi:hypothetical protein
MAGSLWASACGSAPVVEMDLVGGYPIAFDKAFQTCQSVLQQMKYEVEKADAIEGTIVTKWAHMMAPKPSVSFRTQARLRVYRISAQSVNVYLVVVHQENGNRENPEVIGQAEWGVDLVDRAKQTEVRDALMKALVSGS